MIFTSIKSRGQKQITPDNNPDIYSGKRCSLGKWTWKSLNIVSPVGCSQSCGKRTCLFLVFAKIPPNALATDYFFCFLCITISILGSTLRNPGQMIYRVCSRSHMVLSNVIQVKTMKSWTSLLFQEQKLESLCVLNSYCSSQWYLTSPTFLVSMSTKNYTFYKCPGSQFFMPLRLLRHWQVAFSRLSLTRLRKKF